jgi:hypothetical protein
MLKTTILGWVMVSWLTTGILTWIFLFHAWFWKFLAVLTVVLVLIGYGIAIDITIGGAVE